MSQYVGVVVNNDSYGVDRIFTYKVPLELRDKIEVGHRVKINFGLGKKVIDGFVIELFDELQEKIPNIKEIKSLGDEEPLFTQDDVRIINFIREKYLSPYIDAIRLFIPKGVTKGVSHKEKVVLYLGNEIKESKYEKEPYLNIYEIVKENQGVYSKTQLSKEFNISLSSINTLINNNHIICKNEVVDRYNNKEYNYYKKRDLNIEQQKVVNDIVFSRSLVHLIKGVTGSGKTEVYMNLVSNVISQGKSAIILVPEIGLTPQMVERFKGRFGRDVAVFHSKLSEGERYDEWHRVKSGKVKLAVGARSALFLPFENLGMIVIDEEHEGTYKSESDPKYNAKEVAEFMANIKFAKLILGSATPSIETYVRVLKEEIKLHELKSRADGAGMPEIHVVDMRDELISGNRSMFSKKLRNYMNEALAKKEQIILFLNRRGFSTFVSCRKCGYVFKCPNCDISLTYHSRGNFLACHYCGNRQNVVNVCPKCKSKYVKYFGIGTEKVEEEISREFQGAKVIRMDLDTTRKKDSYELIYNKFKNGEADILIGTQMVTKGLDFPNVTVVGVIAADMSLNIPDYRCGEKTFQILTQVSGRAGRGKKAGNVIVQTYLPQNYSLRFTKEYNYEGFFKEEVALRKAMRYPPFSNILLINISSKNEEILIKNIQSIGIILRNKIKNSDKIEIMGPCPCIISKIKELYRWQIIIKGEFSLEFAKKVKEIVYEASKDNQSAVRISIDINPNSLI